MSQTPGSKDIISINQDNIIYSISDEEKKAFVIGNDQANGDILIPRAIIYESNEYLVTKILKNSFENAKTIKSVHFAVDSEINTIEENSFKNSSIETISIPPHVTFISKNAFIQCTKLQEVFIPDNSELKMIDSRAFYGTNIEKFTIPPHLTIIGEYTFAYCKKLKRLEIPANSELQSFDQYSFFGTSFETFTVPPHLKFIGARAFCRCKYLHSFEIPENSELQKIEMEAFAHSPIESLTFPSHLIELDERWGQYMKLKKVSVSSKNNGNYKIYDDKFILGKSSKEKNDYDVLVISVHTIEKATIPDFVEFISPSSFFGCQHLREVEFSKNSKLRSIGRCAFVNSIFESFTIPPHLTFIGEYAFASCPKLIKIEIPENSELRTIGKKAFYNSKIECLEIPKSVIELQDDWCYCAYKLTKAKVHPNNPRYSMHNDKLMIGKSSIDLQNHDEIVFANRDIEFVQIPKFIKIIKKSAFLQSKVRKVEIPADSELRIIDDFAFGETPIVRFTISHHITEIGKWAFNPCKQLKYFEVPFDSELKSIGDNAFSEAPIERFTIPRHLTIIGKEAFSKCAKLRRIDVPNDAELQTIGECAFDRTSIVSFVIPPRIKQIEREAFAFCRCLQIVEIAENSALKTFNLNIFCDLYYKTEVYAQPSQIMNFIKEE